MEFVIIKELAVFTHSRKFLAALSRYAAKGAKNEERDLETSSLIPMQVLRSLI
jgi:hypothetical protein